MRKIRIAVMTIASLLVAALFIGTASASMHPPRHPQSGQIVWNQDFESPICGVWSTVQNDLYSSSCAKFTSNDRLSFPENAGEAGRGDSVAHFRLLPGDRAAGGNRSEVSGGGTPWKVYEGHDREIQFALRLAPDFQFPGKGEWMILGQLHAGEGSPPLVIGFDGSGNLQVRSNGGGTVPDRTLIPADVASRTRNTHWNIWIHFVGSTNSRVGGVEAWAGHATAGTYHLPWASGKTMTDDSSYWKIGLYGSDYQSIPLAMAVDDITYSRRN